VEISENSVNWINDHFDDCYFSSSDGYDESKYVFVEGNDLAERFQKGGSFHIGETGFGTGLNLLCLVEYIQSGYERVSEIQFSSLEKYPLTAMRIKELLSPFCSRLVRNLETYLMFWSALHQELKPGWNSCMWAFDNLKVNFNLYYGDALEWCSAPFPGRVDAWFLDGHSPDKNPVIWSPAVMESVFERTAPGGTLASFTASGHVKKPLRDAGFYIKRKKGFGAKRHMIQGSKT